jgi:antitoxin component of MazEF toxin-antitoxin module
MNKLSKILIPILVLTTLMISACTGSAVSKGTSGGSKVEAALVKFTGVIEAMDGNEWMVGGQAVTVDPSMLRDVSFNIGDTIKLEAEVQADGSLVVTRLESSAADDNSNDANSNDANSNDSNSNDSNSNDDNGNDDNSNDDNGNDDDSGGGNDDNGNGDDSGGGNDDNGNDD